MLDDREPRPKSDTGQIYADLIRTVVVPDDRDLYPRGDSIQQDDGAKIRHTQEVLETVQENLKHRVPIDIQAPKMADIWAIENVWAIVKENVKVVEPKNQEALRKVIIHSDKALLLRVMSSIAFPGCDRQGGCSDQQEGL